jgi:hypothetical protein
MAPWMKEEKIKDVSNVFKKHKIDGPGASVRFETRSWVQASQKYLCEAILTCWKRFLKLCQISGN